MKKAITFDIKGIKCDSPLCDYKDMSVEFDPDKYLDMPCPKCGCNLFTQKDYDLMIRMFRVANIINLVFAPFMWIFKNNKRLWHNVETDGSGKARIGEGVER